MSLDTWKQVTSLASCAPGCLFYAKERDDAIEELTSEKQAKNDLQAQLESAKQKQQEVERKALVAQTKVGLRW